MIYFDVTKTGDAGHRSGLTRVSGKLLAGLGTSATPVRWNSWNRTMAAGDWFFTAELFSEDERVGITEFLKSSPGRKAAVFHDAIPLKFPETTWPQSVARHPGYMKLLSYFDRIWADSAASRDELVGLWKWQGVDRVPPVDVLALGADFDGSPRVRALAPVLRAKPVLLSVGIVEPRKNQMLLLDVAEELWSTGLEFELHVVGRINPHFGRPIAQRLKSLSGKFPGLHFHEAARDQVVSDLYRRARATLFPTRAEGCGLPLLESLWRGVPCVCTDLPVLRENFSGGGCLAVALDDRPAWCEAIRRIVTDEALHARLVAEATSRQLPTWTDAAATLKAKLQVF